MADQAAIVQELYKRRGELSPDKVAVVDELAKRFNIGQTPIDVAKAKYAPFTDPPKDEGFLTGLGRTINLVEMVRGLANAVTSPIETGKAVIQSQGEQFTKAGENFRRGRYSEALGHGLAGAVPLVGPAAANAAEKIGDNPLGEGLGEAAGLLATTVLPSMAAKAIKRTANAAPAIGEAIGKSAEGNYLSLLAPGKRDVLKAEQVAKFLRKERPVAATREGLIERAAAETKKAGPAAGTAYVNKAPLSAKGVQGIYDDLDRLKTKATVETPKGVRVIDESFHGAVNKLQNDLIEMTDDLGQVSQKSLDDFRDILSRGLTTGGGRQIEAGPQTVKMIQAKTRQSIKRALDAENPTAADLNTTFHLWSKAHDFFEDVRKSKIAAQSGIVKGSSQGFGALAQRMLPRPVREIPANLVGVFDSVPWNTVSGATKSVIADALANGKWQTATGLMARQIARGAGAAERVQEAIAQQPSGQ